MTALSMEFYNALRGVGVDDGKARAVAEIVAEQFTAQNKELTEVKSEVAVIKSDRKNLATKADLGDLKNDLLKWVFGIVFGAAIAIIGINIAVIALAVNYLTTLINQLHG